MTTLATAQAPAPIAKVELSVRNAPSTGLLIPPGDPVFRYLGAVVQPFGDAFPRKNFVNTHLMITSKNNEPPYSVEFQVRGSEFEIVELGNKGKIRISVNGAPITEVLQATPPDGGIYLRKVQFRSAALRTIRLDVANYAFGGLRVMSGTTVTAPNTARQPRAMFVGDSYTEGGTGAAASFTAYPATVGRLMNWEVWNSGVGGTGYTRGGPSGRVRLSERLERDVIAHRPDIVLLAYGHNDSDPGSELDREARNVVRRLKVSLPATRIIMVGPFSEQTPPPAHIPLVRDILKSVADDEGLLWVDPIDWITGNKRTGSPGNAIDYIQDDYVHPTQKGHDYIGQRLAQEIRARW
ncbi:SGNH/GDSL hydrolase family protein [Deinococcus knuensis]|nr:SGNH/GDSL hydrolase family protein [Deinococcus knuensis]